VYEIGNKFVLALAAMLLFLCKQANFLSSLAPLVLIVFLKCLLVCKVYISWNM